MNTIQPEPHVAQQSRRDKLRVQQNLPPPPPHHPHHHLYDAPPMFTSPSGILDFTTPTADASFMNAAASGLHDGGWIMNCVGGGGAGAGGAGPGPGPGHGPGVSPIQIPCFPSHLYHMKQGISGYHDLSSELTTSQESHKHFGDLHFPSPHIYHSTLHDVVTSSSSAVPMEPGWGDGGNELLLLPSYANPANSSVWMNRQNQQWYAEGEAARMKGETGIGAALPGSTQSLSLSLSSNPLPELQESQFEERLGQEDLAALHASRSAAGDVVGFSSPYPRASGSSVPGPIVASADPRRCIGPLGPFTGYAAILKSSKFLKPAQLLLDEFCSAAAGLKLTRQRESLERSSGAGSGRHDQALIGDSGGDGMRGNSCVSSSSFYSSTEGGGGGGSGGTGSGSTSCQIHRPEFQQKKAKLLYMQEEVCRRYKQYHQQMQMVVSSFESVAGLSAATPYTSLALKSIAKHFRCLKNAISDQLRHVSKLMGEEFMSSPGSSKGDAITPGLKYVDQSIRKHKAAENSLSFLDHSQPVWRPQRGLPERAVAVLRAWLFDHFLHPYPTDTDKHMLATQTGLSRNQVSNWFINARVRLWKPMVEEIHMLETKGMSGMDLNSTNRNEGKPVQDEVGPGQPSSDQMSEAHSNKPMDCSHLEPMFDEESSRAMEQWHREKRSRMEECGIPDGSLMSFAAYQGGLDIGGLGAVSLTLGLRHNEGAQQQQQQHMRRHFGNHMVHDFGG